MTAGKLHPGMMNPKRLQTSNRSHRHLADLFLLAVGLQLMVACSVFVPGEPLTGTAPLQNQRAAKALSDLSEMEEIDTLIRLDNQWLGNRFETALQSRAALGRTYNIRNIRTIFTNQIIGLEAVVDIYDEDRNRLDSNAVG